MTFTLIHAVENETGTVSLAEDVAAIVRPGDVITLEGDLGMGKSAFARALIRALADDDALEVPSPTFTLVQTYDLPRFAVSHFDLYRLGDPDELREIGFDEAIRTSVTLVEWPERAGRALPADRLTISIADGPTHDARVFTLSGAADRWAERLDRSFRIRVLLEGAGFTGARRRHLQGDASARSHERIRTDNRRAVAMNWPRRGPQPVLADGLSYPELVHVQDDPASFVAIGETLRAKGFKAPKLYATDVTRGLLVQEDFGSETIVRNGQPIEERYLAAALLLAEKDKLCWPARIELPGEATWTVPPYDRRALLVELSLCPDWYGPHVTGHAISPGERAAFMALWEPLVDRLCASEQGWVLRDVHSPNLMWLGGSDPKTRLGLIDYQDAMIGPTAYDVMSLATDVRLTIPPDLRQAIKDAYAEARGPDFDRPAFEEAFALASAQRNTKILGGFARSARRDGKPAYLAHIPRVRGLIGEALRHPVLAPLRVWYERHDLIA
jgi:tRNA threonylcarbamoyl adenosine modification protein YjeE